MQALLKKYPNLSMPVYPTHRAFANPQSVYDATKAQAGQGQAQSLTISNYTCRERLSRFRRWRGGGLQHLTRFFGSYSKCATGCRCRPNGEYYRVGFCEDFVQGQNFDQRQKNHVFSFYGGYDRAGHAWWARSTWMHDPIDYSTDSRQAWIYTPASAVCAALRPRLRPAPMATKACAGTTITGASTARWTATNGSSSASARCTSLPTATRPTTAS